MIGLRAFDTEWEKFKFLIGPGGVGPYRKVFIFSIVITFSEIASIGLLLPLLEASNSANEGVSLLTISLPTNVFLCLTLGVIFSCIALTFFGQRALLINGARLGALIGERMFGALLNCKFEYKNQILDSTFINLCINESARAAHQVVIPFSKLIGKLFFTLILLGVLFVASPFIGFLLGTIFLVFYTLVFVVVRPKLKAAGQDISASTRARIGKTSALFRAFSEVIIFNIQTPVYEDYRAESLKFGRALGQSQFLSVAPRYLLEGAFVFVVALFIVLSNSGEKNQTGVSDDVIVIVILIIRLFPVAQEVYQSIAAIRSHWDAYTACRDWVLPDSSSDLEFSPSIFDFEQRSKFSVDSPAVEGDEVRCLSLSAKNISYQIDGRLILNDVNLSCKSGDFVSIIGASGSGKSTLANILAGLLRPDTGSISWSEVSGRAFVSPRIAIVTQNPEMLDGTVKFNICLKKQISKEKIVVLDQIIKGLELEKLLSALPRGLDTPLSSKGVLLSGGEVQRIAIARALFFDPEVLILDEGTSALDLQTEAQFISFMSEHFPNILVISVAHRKTMIDAGTVVVDLG